MRVLFLVLKEKTKKSKNENENENENEKEKKKEKNMNEKRKVVKHIVIMSIFGIVLSGGAVLVSNSVEMLLVMGIVPLACCVAFLITKHPVFGIIYSVLFGLSRIELLQGGTLLVIAVIVVMLIYFIYVDRICYQYHKKYKSVEK